MTIVGKNVLTLKDHAKRTDPDGRIASIVELLSETNEILDDMLWQEGNLPTGHRTTVRSGLPAVAWRKLNYGVMPGKSTTVQVDDAVGSLEAYSEVDRDLAMLNGNTTDFRLSEASAFLEAMSRELSKTLFYGDTDQNPERFLGLSSRFSSLAAENGGNVIDAGGNSADLSSIWVVTWGARTCHGIFPKGSRAGIEHQDLGEVTLDDEDGGKYQGFRDHWQWKAGLSLRDWRYVVRVANVDVSEALSGSTRLDLLLIRALGRIPSLNAGKTAIYCNTDLKTALDVEAANNQNMNLKLDEFGGKPVTAFRGVPIRKVDAIVSNETRVA